MVTKVHFRPFVGNASTRLAKGYFTILCITQLNAILRGVCRLPKDSHLIEISLLAQIHLQPLVILSTTAPT